MALADLGPADTVNVQVFLVRHGETDFNRRGLVLGQVDEVSESIIIKGWSDISI